MHYGLSLQDMAKRLEADAAAKHDVVASARACFVQAYQPSDDHPADIQLSVEGDGTYRMQPLASDQLRQWADIPAKYWTRMQNAAPDLLAANVNEWLGRSRSKRMVRTMRGNARAWLSDRYHRIEHDQIARMALPVLMDYPGLKIRSCEVTDRRLYICATLPSVQGEVKVGDVVQAGVRITNSEVGFGTFSVSPFVLRLVCDNGMTMPDSALKVRHAGRRVDEGVLDDVYADDTRRADDKALMLKVRDLTRHALSEAGLQESLTQMRALTERKVEGDPAKSVEVLAQNIGATETERGDILRALIEGGDLSAWGLANAVTAQAHKPELSYDRAAEFTEIGGKLATMPANKWQPILEAA